MLCAIKNKTKTKKMKQIIFILISLIISLITKGQDLNGKWKGGLPQNDKTFVFTMEADITHRGSEISGKIKYVDPTTKDYVVEKFIGSVNGSKVTINEYEIIDSYINSNGNYGWCVKTMEGRINVNRSENTITIEGTWFSNKVWYKNTQKISQGNCAPGKFIISKELESLSKISGVVYDKEKLQGIQAQLIFQDNKEMKRCQTDRSGYYSIEINSDSNYRIVVKSSGFEEQAENIFTDEENLTKNFFLDKIVKKELPPKIPVNQKVRLKNVLFKQSKSEILSESFTELNTIFNFLQENPNTLILIEGHTDRIGDSDKNLILSKQRAEAIKKYFTDKGINGDRITTVGYGDNIIICEPECKENRRVEFIITRK